MDKEALFGTYDGVKFYGLGQLSFVYWCSTNGIKITNNVNNVVMKTSDGSKSLKPIFYLPDHDLYLDVRSSQEHNKYRRNYEYQLRSAVSKNNANFIYLVAEKIGTLDFMQARKLLLECPKSNITPLLISKLNMLNTKSKVSIERIGMPRWFRNHLAEVRKAQNVTTEQTLEVPTEV